MSARMNGYMCSDLAEMVQQSDEQWIKNFIEAFEEGGGPHLKFEVFWEHYMLSWLLQGLAVVDLPRQLILTGSPYMTNEGWLGIKSYKDPRIFRLPNYNNGMCAIIRNFVYYWRCRDLPSFWESWKKEHLDWEKKGPWTLKAKVHERWYPLKDFLHCDRMVDSQAGVASVCEYFPP